MAKLKSQGMTHAISFFQSFIIYVITLFSFSFEALQSLFFLLWAEAITSRGPLYGSVGIYIPKANQVLISFFIFFPTMR